MLELSSGRSVFRDSKDIDGGRSEMLYVTKKKVRVRKTRGFLFRNVSFYVRCRDIKKFD